LNAILTDLALKNTYSGFEITDYTNHREIKIIHFSLAHRLDGDFEWKRRFFNSNITILIKMSKGYTIIYFVAF
jgi:hypothetical protein